MKRFPKSILRACCAIAGGVVLVIGSHQFH